MKKLIIPLMILLLSFPVYAESNVEVVNEYREIFSGMTEEDFEALSEVVYWESARCCCPHEVNVAVVETVMNRVLSDEFPDTANDVCRQRGQFVCKPIPKKASREAIDDAIAQVYVVGRQVLPGTDFIYFASKKQSIAKDHIWIGRTKNGKTVRYGGMWFGRGK